ncbi:DUF4105 domain-containing protein [bacterium]|nr:DUF4105 domain-containing protein [bacterium]
MDLTNDRGLERAPSFLCAALIAAILAAFATIARADDAALGAYVEAKVEAANQAALADDPYWHRLLHYRPTLYGGVKSQADGRGFFLAPDGKTNPREEIAATIRGIFAPAQPDEHGLPQHPMCRFPARAIWLTAKLDLDVTRGHQKACPRFATYMARLRPTAVSLVFSSYYLNNPSSAFGHTFLRFYQGDPRDAAKKREIVDYGIDFSADVDTGNAIVYAFKGLTGLFPGTYKRIPYYYKVREYNDSESRDLWEYELDFNEAQVWLVAAHIWELGSTHYDYFYLTENCSYHILGALEAAGTDVDLTSRTRFPVLPADTVKVLFEHPGLVRDIIYRPSVRTQFRRRVATLDGRERAMVVRLMEDPNADFDPRFDRTSQRNILDAAADLIEFLFGHELIYKTNSEAARKKQIILERRAAIREPSPPPDFSARPGDHPESGHGSLRLGIGPGFFADGGGFFDLSFRLALHDLADPPDGYPELMQLDFLPTTIRVEQREGRAVVEDSDFVRIVSLTPVDRFDHRMSWDFRAGVTTPRDEYCTGCTGAVAQIGGGATLATAGERVAFFALGEVRVFGSSEIAGYDDWPVIAGGGPAAGLRIAFSDRVVDLVRGQWLFFPGQGAGQSYDATHTLRWAVAQNLALDFDARVRPRAIEGRLMFNLYL